jgi:hypothetical protein
LQLDPNHQICCFCTFLLGAVNNLDHPPKHNNNDDNNNNLESTLRKQPTTSTIMNYDAMTDAEKEYARFMRAQDPTFQYYPLPGQGPLTDRTRSSVGMHEPPYPTYPLPSSGDLTHRTRASTPLFSNAPASIPQSGLVDAPGSFDPSTFDRHGSCTTQEKTKTPGAAIKDPNPYDTVPFNLSNLRSALDRLAPRSIARRTTKADDAVLEKLIAGLPKPRAARALPFVQKPNTNPFFHQSMNVEQFAEDAKRKMDVCLRILKDWEEMLPTEFVTYAHKVKGRQNLVNICTTSICLAQVLVLGRPDWNLLALSDEFFDHVLEAMEEIHELADILAKHRGCSWLREMLARPCYDARLVLSKVQQKKKGLRSSKRCKEMEQRKWEENERKKIERNLKAGWQGEPM